MKKKGLLMTQGITSPTIKVGDVIYDFRNKAHLLVVEFGGDSIKLKDSMNKYLYHIPSESGVVGTVGFISGYMHNCNEWLVSIRGESLGYCVVPTSIEYTEAMTITWLNYWASLYNYKNEKTGLEESAR